MPYPYCINGKSNRFLSVVINEMLKGFEKFCRLISRCFLYLLLGFVDQKGGFYLRALNFRENLLVPSSWEINFDVA